VHIGILDVHTMPEGYYYYGASGGRDWYLSAERPECRFKVLSRVSTFSTTTISG
jgi:hypothetical protein